VQFEDRSGNIPSVDSPLFGSYNFRRRRRKRTPE
jgi:hypothetical protein